MVLVSYVHDGIVMVELDTPKVGRNVSSEPPDERIEYGMQPSQILEMTSMLFTLVS